VALADTQQLGVYRLEWGEADRSSFVVNLFSPQESDIEPAASLPALEASASGGAGSETQARREWWRVLALFSLVLLTAEWLVYQRSALARLTGLLRRPPAQWKPTRRKRA
jgi:hypothetical protein